MIICKHCGKEIKELQGLFGGMVIWIHIHNKSSHCNPNVAEPKGEQ